MAYSTLYSTDTPHPETEDASHGPSCEVGVLPSGRVVHHGVPDTPIPEGAVIYRDGTTPWTWNAVAEEFPDVAAVVLPQEYAGEPTAQDVDVTLFPRMTPLDSSAR